MQYVVRLFEFEHKAGTLKINLYKEFKAIFNDEEELRNYITGWYRYEINFAETQDGFYRCIHKKGISYITFKREELAGICEWCGSKKVTMLFPTEACDNCKKTETVRQLYLEKLESEIGIKPFNFTVDVNMYLNWKEFNLDAHRELLDKIEESAATVDLQSIKSFIQDLRLVPMTPSNAGLTGIILLCVSIRLLGAQASTIIYEAGSQTMLQIMNELNAPLPDLNFKAH